MKKFFVSLVVVIAFISYCLYQKIYGIQTAPVVVPKNIINMQQITPSSTLFPAQSSQSSAAPSSVLSAPQGTSISTPTPKLGYKDGIYVGDPADAFYGNIQVQATISNGKITDVKFLQYPNDRDTSIAINSQADPMLGKEAIEAQSSNVNIISGATDSSNAFIQSLQSALNKAKASI
jgi:uncharacterized protein with FMN-binding domain